MNKMDGREVSAALVNGIVQTGATNQSRTLGVTNKEVEGRGNWLSYKRTRDLETAELLVQLPALQQLLFRLINCQPQGATVYNFVIQLALSMLFQMQRHDALKALEIYRRRVNKLRDCQNFMKCAKALILDVEKKVLKLISHLCRFSQLWRSMLEKLNELQLLER